MSNSINNEKKKISFEKKIVIFLIVFLLLSVLVTAGFIYYKNEIEYVGSNKNENENTQTVNENFGLDSLNETYAVNDIKYSTIEEAYGDYAEEWGYSKIHVNYVQISGLKNHTIQNKINQKIKKAAEELYEYSFLNDENIAYVDINCYVTANFANVLSIQLDRYISYKNDQISDIHFEGLNYNLATGEEIAFEKLFTADANIKSILTQSAYEYFSFEYINNYDDLSADMDLIDYSDIERKVFLLLNKYNNGELTNFFFDASDIYVIKDNEISISIEMQNFYEQIAIYNRYKSYSNIYNGEYEKNLKDIPCFFDANYKYYYEFGEVADNVLASIHVYPNEEYSYVLDPLYDKYIESEKLSYIESAEKNVMYEASIQAGVYEGIIHLSIDKVKYELIPEKYEEIRDNVVYENLRNAEIYEGIYILAYSENDNEYYTGYTNTQTYYEYDLYSGRLLSERRTVSHYDVKTEEYVEIEQEEIFY